MQEIDMFKISFHIFATIHFSYGCYYDWNYVKVPTKDHIMGLDFAGKLKFLTYWDAVSIFLNYISRYFYFECTWICLQML